MADPEELIKLIYDGVSDAAARSLALAKFAERVRAEGAALGIQDMRTHRFRGLGDVGIDISLTPTYRRLAPSNTIWREIAARKRALTDGMVIRKSEFVRTELYADWFSPQRFHSVMAAPTLFESAACAVVVAFRNAPRGDFEAVDLAEAKRFGAHFGAALRFRFAEERMAAELAAANFVLDELPDAIFLVSGAGFLHHANTAARTMLDTRAPARLHRGRLELCQPIDTERLYRMMAAGHGEFRLPNHARGSWIVRLHQGAQRFGPVDGDCMIVRILDPDRRHEPLDAVRLSGRLGITRRQAQAVAALLQSRTEDGASARLGVTKATLHTHLSRVYAHLGVHNRAELVALLAGHGFEVSLGDEK